MARQKNLMRNLTVDDYMQLPKFLRTAYKIASKSTGEFKLGAVLVRCGKPISVGFNKYNATNKLAREFFGVPTIHAECDALHRAASMDTHGCTLYVVRVRPRGEVGLSKPCFRCRSLLKAKGIRKVIYTTSEAPFFFEERI